MHAAWIALCFLAWSSGPADTAPALPAPGQVRAAFLKMLDRPKVPLDPSVGELKVNADGTVLEHVVISTEKKRGGAVERVPMTILHPAAAAGRKPTVIVLHGTGGSKDGNRERETMARLAAKGIMAVAIDARYHGERVAGAKGAEAYNAAILAAWRAKPAEQEHPFYYDTVWDLWRTVDYLQSRRDVDPQRLGMIGFSMGGIETWLAASADDRIKVMVPAIGVQSFRYSLEHEQWQGRARTIALAHEAAAKDLGEPAVNARVCRALWTKVIPGILDRFDCPSMLRLMAPRPLLILSGEEDPNCPIGGARVAYQSAEAAYRAASAGDKLKILVAPKVGHKVTDDQLQAAVAWFVSWLKP
jgi:dienelactone hydrolase